MRAKPAQSAQAAKRDPCSRAPLVGTGPLVVLRCGAGVGQSGLARAPIDAAVCTPRPPGLERQPGLASPGTGGPLRCPRPEPGLCSAGRPARGLERAAAARGLRDLRARSGPVVLRGAAVQPRGGGVRPQRHLRPLHSGEAGLLNQGPCPAGLLRESTVCPKTGGRFSSRSCCC